MNGFYRWACLRALACYIAGRDRIDSAWIIDIGR